MKKIITLSILLSFTAGMSYASISSVVCTGSTMTVTTTEVLSSAAKVRYDNNTLDSSLFTSAYSFSNGNRTISFSEDSPCDTIPTSAVSVIDNGTVIN